MRQIRGSVYLLMARENEKKTTLCYSACLKVVALLNSTRGSQHTLIRFLNIESARGAELA